MTHLSKQQQLLEEQGRTDSHLHYEGKLISVRSDRITDQHQHTHQYDIVLHPGAAVMIPVHKNGMIHLVKQWRRAALDILIALPAGTLKQHEHPLHCAQRELQEEIGYKAKRITSLGGFFTAPGFCNEYLHLFVAEDLIPRSLPADDNEHIDPCLLSLEESLEWIDRGKIKDAKTICGIYRYLRWIG